MATLIRISSAEFIKEHDKNIFYFGELSHESMHHLTLSDNRDRALRNALSDFTLEKALSLMGVDTFRLTVFIETLGGSPVMEIAGEKIRGRELDCILIQSDNLDDSSRSKLIERLRIYGGGSKTTTDPSSFNEALRRITDLQTQKAPTALPPQSNYIQW